MQIIQIIHFMELHGESKKINSSDEKIFHLVSNCSNFGKYLPPDVTGFESTTEYCKFTMKNVADFKIEITEKQPYRLVSFKADNDKKIPISLSIFIENKETYSLLQIKLNADIPFFLQGMVKTPLQKFVDILEDKIKLEAEKE